MAVSYLLLWGLIGFGLLVSASFVGTVLGLQYYHNGGRLSVSFDAFIHRLTRERR